MRNEGLSKTLIAGAAVAARRIVKFGASDTAVLQAAAATDLSIGVADLGAASGEYCDVIVDGIALVEYGGNVTRGAKLTSDADGKAIAAAPAAGANAQVIGIAMLSGVAGDIGSVRIAPSTMQGA
ncbi:MAG: capsid cement protein [Steroidobacteraceae bacterium]